MRDAATHMKNQRRGRPDPGEFDRPRARFGEGNYRMPFGTHGNRHPPRMDGDEPFVGTRFPNSHRSNSEGLSNNYVERLFEYEREDLWPRRGFISPYKNYQGRPARRLREFELWLHWHPYWDYVESRMLYEYDRGRGRPFDYISNSHRRVSHRQGRSIDIEDPRYSPPYPTDKSAYVQGLRGNIPNEVFRELRRRVHERHSHTQRPHGAGGRSHPPHPFYEASQDRSPHLPRRHHENRDRSNSRRHHPRTNPGYNPHFYNGYPQYTNPRTRHHPPHEYEDEDEDDFSDDLSSQSSNESYIRTPRHQSPDIVFPHPPPYNGHPLGHNGRSSRPRRHETYTDDEDGDGYFSHRTRGRSRRDSGRSRRGSRHYDGDHVDYDFSGDEDDRYGY